MKSLNKLQITLIVFSVLLFVLLYFANKTPDLTEKSFKSTGTESTEIASFESVLKNYINSLPNDEKSKVNRLISDFEKDKIKNTDTLVQFLGQQKQPALAAYFSELKANFTKKVNDYEIAGDRYYYSVRFLNKPEEIQIAYNCAIRSFNKVLTVLPNNIAVKIKLASCVVEGTSDPMKGISLLREVEKTDSNNVDLQLAFAAFSSKSGQIDKAISRFEKVLKLKPDYLEAYLYLADAYEKKGDKQKAISALESYSLLIEDEGAKKEIKKYINQLKEN
jgi:tetratricopeptide (TPR) repeat protein